MSEAWKLAGDVIKKAQGQQKQQHDVWAQATTFTEGQLVFMFMHAGRSGKAYKLARPFHGPYRVVRVVENGFLSWTSESAPCNSDWSGFESSPPVF